MPFATGRQPLVTLGPRVYQWIRRLMAVMSIVMFGLAAFAFAATWLPSPDERAVFGLWFLGLGAFMGLWAWRGRWRPHETDEERAREEELSRLLEPFITGAELLFLSLALLGAAWPDVLGELWTEHRTSVQMFAMLAIIDLAVRAWRRRSPRAASPTQ